MAQPGDIRDDPLSDVVIIGRHDRGASTDVGQKAHGPMLASKLVHTETTNTVGVQLTSDPAKVVGAANCNRGRSSYRGVLELIKLSENTLNVGGEQTFSERSDEGGQGWVFLLIEAVKEPLHQGQLPAGCAMRKPGTQPENPATRARVTTFLVSSC
jgi:hypothetical protein